MKLFNFRNQEKMRFLSDHKSQLKGLKGWKMPPTHTHTPWVPRFHDFWPLGLISDLTKARKFLGPSNNLQN